VIAPQIHFPLTLFRVYFKALAFHFVFSHFILPERMMSTNIANITRRIRQTCAVEIARTIRTGTLKNPKKRRNKTFELLNEIVEFQIT
jgi:hypothetical protein